MRWSAWFLWGCVVGCGGAPPPPAYVPENSPEPATVCRQEAALAKKARTAAIGDEQSTLREAAAERTFAHAECEFRQFETLPLDANDPDALRVLATEMRAQYQSARNLYLETDHYGSSRFRVGAWSRAGDLDSLMGAKLRTMLLPAHASDPAEAAADAQALEDVVKHFDLEAHKSYTTALERSEGHSAESDVGAWVKAACEGLRRLSSKDAGRFARCSP